MSVSGQIETIEEGCIAGWARDAERPMRRLEVFLWIDGRLAGRTLANRARPDLEQAGIGDGRHGFAFVDLVPTAAQELRVTTADGADVPGSPTRPRARRRRNGRADPGGITVIAVARDAAPGIEEWIAHHRALGVDRFVVCDAAVADGPGARLSRNRNIDGLVEVVPLSRSPISCGDRHRVPAETGMIAAVAGRANWLIFLDIDEFIVPLADNDIPQLLARFSDVAALSLCRKVFRSLASGPDDDRLLTDRARFATGTGPGGIIARPWAVASFDGHLARLEAGALVDELRRPIGHGLSARPPTFRWGQINRYLPDPPAGPSSGRSSTRPAQAYDLAPEHDIAIRRFRGPMLHWLRQLFPERACATRAATPLLHRPRPALVPIPTRLWEAMAGSSGRRAHGAIDHPPRSEGEIKVSAATPLRLAGWLFDANGRPDQERLIRLHSADHPSIFDYLVVVDDSRSRPDIVQHFPGLSETVTRRSGFDVVLDVRSIPLGRYRIRSGVVSELGVVWTAVDRPMRIV
ncbi:hypothetical protein STAQ_16170 [Allostella sp. ATCC 35155]|nr:hypothetical protein STAQ_16170 [Stella sp. ATCC 35155]